MASNGMHGCMWQRLGSLCSLRNQIGEHWCKSMYLVIQVVFYLVFFGQKRFSYKIWGHLSLKDSHFLFYKRHSLKKASIRNVINYSWERWLTHTIGSCPISLLTPRSLKSLIKQTEAASALLDVEPPMSQLTTMRQHSNFIGVKLKWASLIKMWKSKFSNFLA